MTCRPSSLGDGRLLGTALVAGLLIFVLHPRLTELRSSGRRLRLGLITRSVRTLDAAGLAVFSVGGALKAVSFSAPPLAAILIGVIATCWPGRYPSCCAGSCMRCPP